MRIEPGTPVYALTTGKLNGDVLTNCHVVGEARFVPDDAYYLLRFAMFPENRYFLKKNSVGQGTYTIYADYVRGAGRSSFRLPVGKGRLIPRIKTHLELRLTLLGKSIYMDLYPYAEVQHEAS